ncbi:MULTISPECIES: RNA polymerase sigma factor [unclassified Polaribacter]|jgi:RNA polymerase sigma factor (sigma-70 family)|uniref:RNA polymerase sigma factor n=1 Tax=unclassified Polaribacter TaxID=196858 RepID=UPI001C4F8515|nr:MULTISPECIES: sigma-70 family RNA polymerase sigma factor [unclassified Polaribacter]QXP64534.1 sigma-70 family RNA polymerase sigma factor [Polaribacter sp. HaHaR_3_91]QXP67030.1 sigma-70 family RNA polymerase sigma factor [Polaribacter sp. AHE13PA]
MKTSISYFETKTEFRLFVTKSFSSLVKLKKEEKQIDFNQLVLKILPEIRKYVNQRLNTAIKKGHFSKKKYKADDIIDQLFITIYDTIDEVENEGDFYLWLYKKTNDLLEDVIVEEEFNELFFKNIDDYSKPDWDEMQEEFSIDGEGDLLLLEEIDDVTYSDNEYSLDHVFVEDDEKDLVDKLDTQLGEDKVNAHIELVLHNMPVAMRIVFYLFTNQKLKIEEIAEIQKKSIPEIEKLLSDAKKAIQRSLFNRYSVSD